MDDLNERLDRLFSDPTAMAKMQSMLSSMTSGTPPSAEAPTAPQTPPPVSQTDDTALLKALRPYVHGERERKLNEAIKLLELSRFLPLIQS